ncbi:hypothetical protein WJX75_000276 [Coccomyxa subellipsoidea]|uniref:Rad9-domain-containing protein n=1 Tax=Coccomyxa subellipsoidea TaxID=248742 RepID=A0ABR2Z2D3_9CHLO
MSLKASIVGLQVKQLKGALQYLAKIGAELLIEALPEKLILRSINSSRSAYASITYTNAFFDAYNVFGSTVVQASVLAKQALALFRTQRIVKIHLELDSAGSKLIAEVSADNGLEKQYRIPCMDSEILQTSVDKDTFPTCVNAAANELNKLLSSFQYNLEEITIIAMPEDLEDEGQGKQGKAVQLHSFVDPAKGHADRTLHTQLSVDTHEPLFHSNNPLEEYVIAELVLATLLETARLGDSGPATVAANARRRVDTPGGGQIPGDTPWRPDGQGVGSPGQGRLPSVSRSGAVAMNTTHQPSRFRTRPEPPRFLESPAQPPLAAAHRSSGDMGVDAYAQPHDGTAEASLGYGNGLLRSRRTPLGRRIDEASERSNMFGTGLGSDPADGDGMGPSSNHNGNTMNMGGTGLIDDGGSRPEVQYEDADYNSMPADEHGRRTIPSGLMDDGSHNPSLFSNNDQGLQPTHERRDRGSAEPQWASRSAAHPSFDQPAGDQGRAVGAYQESEWQEAGPIQRRYLAAEMYDDDDEDLDDDEAIPGTP